jgi:hypothetical protein
LREPSRRPGSPVVAAPDTGSFRSFRQTRSGNRAPLPNRRNSRMRRRPSTCSSVRRQVSATSRVQRALEEIAHQASSCRDLKDVRAPWTIESIVYSGDVFPSL